MSPCPPLSCPRATNVSARGSIAPARFMLVALLLCLHIASSRACTAIVVGHAAMIDGAGYTSSTSDCLDCDFRLARVPRRSRGGNPGSRPVYLCNAQYPHVVQRGRAETWEPENLEGTLHQLKTWKAGSKPIGNVPEVENTFALLETGAGYGIINEKMVAMGESTCLGKFVAAPVNDGGNALFDIGELSRVALERTSTARDAIKLMGDMAENYGYYGAAWDGPGKFDEAGENLMVSDPNEAWVFHILPDDTGKSAIWAAQRVPEDHITVVANQFIIRNINSTDHVNFMHSSNMYSIAENHGFYNAKRDGPHLDFTKCFSALRPHSSYTTHRVYRVFTLANPDLIGVLDPYPSALMDGYPFSVKPKRKLTVEDLFRMNRDHYEGSSWDMTKSMPAQPYGDPDRYDTGAVGNMTKDEAKDAGEFSRAISIGRTSYTTISRSTRFMPDVVGAMTYFAQQQPDSSVFIPVYVAANNMPRALTVGSLFKFHPDSMFWAVAAVSNWVHRYYLMAIGDLRLVQSSFEKQFAVDDIEADALALAKRGQEASAAHLLGNFTATATATALRLYKELFPHLIARFHDGFRSKLRECPFTYTLHDFPLSVVFVGSLCSHLVACPVDSWFLGLLTKFSFVLFLWYPF